MKIWQKYLGVEDSEVNDYHRLARREMIDLFSSPRKRVVEIGCSAGYTGKYCKEKFPSVEYWGFELNKAAAKEALGNLDKVVCGKFEDQQLDVLGLAPHSVDGVVLGDVLEHMYDPWRVLVSLLPWLNEDAEVVVSLPNVRNLWLLNEIAEGRFTYDQHGLLDITHLRFFTVNEIQELMNSTGYSIATGSFIIDERLQDYLAAGDGKTGPCVFHYRSISLTSKAEMLSELCAKQFLFRAVPKKTALLHTSAPPSNLLKSLISDHDASQERDPTAYVDQLPPIQSWRPQRGARMSRLRLLSAAISSDTGKLQVVGRRLYRMDERHARQAGFQRALSAAPSWRAGILRFAHPRDHGSAGGARQTGRHRRFCVLLLLVQRQVHARDAPAAAHGAL